MNSVCCFEIQSSNPQRDVKFYSEVFGWEFIKLAGLPIDYYKIQTNGIAGGLLSRPAKVPSQEQGTNAFTCSFKVENFDSTQETILRLGGSIAMPKFAVPGISWQGYFIDPDNNTFGVIQEDKNAV